MNEDTNCGPDGHGDGCCGRYNVFMTDINSLTESLVNQFDSIMNELMTNQRLPARKFRGSFLPALRSDLRVDVREHDDDVIVVADIPGASKEDISVQIVDPRTIQISSQRNIEQEKDEEGYYMRERMFGSTSRLVHLPADVKDSDFTGSFKNGVLEIRLKKTPEEKGKIIPIE